MNGLIVDSSIALTWCFEDEATDETDQLFARVRDEGATVPGLWFLEVGNVLLQAEKRGRITAASSAARLDLIAVLPISVDQETTRRAWNDIQTLARSEGLTAYDACYLELAIRRDLPLATRDRALADAAVRHTISVLPALTKPGARRAPKTKR